MDFNTFVKTARSGGADLLNSINGKRSELVGQIQNIRNNGDFKDILATAKLNDVLKRDEEDAEMKNRSPIITVLAVIGAIVAVACIAFAVYKYFTPDYLDDFDDGDDLDDFDDEDDLFEDEDDLKDTAKDSL